MLPLLETATSTAEALNAFATKASWLQAMLATMFDPAWNQDHATVIWTTVLIVLALTGIGLPTPEDIWLTLAGFSAYKQGGDHFVWYHFALTLAGCAFAILLGDTGAWYLGRKLGFGIRDRFKFMRRLLNEKRMRKVQGWFDNYGNWTVFLGRQVAGVRFVTFFSAGTMKMPLTRFWLFDALGCLVSVPIWLTLGALASIYGREWLEKASKSVGGGLMLAGVIAIAVFVIVIKVRAARRAKKDAADIETEIRLTTRMKSTPESAE